MPRFPHPSTHPSLALIATVGGRLATRHERLRTPEDLDAWLAEYGYAAPATGEADLDAFRRLREAVLDLADAARTGTEPPRDSVRLVNEAAAGPAPVARWAGDRFEPPAGVPGALAAIARDAVDIITGPQAGDLHQCEATDCATVFLRPSTGRARRWCTSEGCGNRARVAAHRQAHT